MGNADRSPTVDRSLAGIPGDHRAAHGAPRPVGRRRLAAAAVRPADAAAGPFDLTGSLADGGQRPSCSLAPADSTLEKDYPAGAQPEDSAEQIRSCRAPGAPDRPAGAGARHGRRSRSPGTSPQTGNEIAAQQAPARSRAPRQRDHDPRRAAGEFATRCDSPTPRCGGAAGRLGRQAGTDDRVRLGRDRSRRQSLDARVTVAVKDVTLDGLLRAVLDQAELRYVREGTVVRVEPKATVADRPSRPAKPPRPPCLRATPDRWSKRLFAVGASVEASRGAPAVDCNCVRSRSNSSATRSGSRSCRCRLGLLYVTFVPSTRRSGFQEGHVVLAGAAFAGASSPPSLPTNTASGSRSVAQSSPAPGPRWPAR